MKVDKNKPLEKELDKSKKKKDPRQFREMITQFNSDQGGFDWGGVEQIKFSAGDLYDKLKPWLDRGVSQFTLQFATYNSEENAAEYCERFDATESEMLSKVTVLI